MTEASTISNPTPAPSEPSLTDGKTSLLDKSIEVGETPPADPAPAPAEPKPADASKPEVPSEYAEFKLPEGFTFEGETLTKAKGLFKELGLDQAGAQKLVDFHTAAIKDSAEAPFKLWSDTQEAWIDELRSDPKIGKDIDSGRVGASISKMISALPTGESAAFREAMNFTGAGNNPAIVRGLYELSKRFAEPGHVQGGSPAPVGKQTRPSPAGALYPNLVKGT